MEESSTMEKHLGTSPAAPPAKRPTLVSPAGRKKHLRTPPAAPPAKRPKLVSPAGHKKLKLVSEALLLANDGVPFCCAMKEDAAFHAMFLALAVGAGLVVVVPRVSGIDPDGLVPYTGSCRGGNDDRVVLLDDKMRGIHGHPICSPHEVLQLALAAEHAEFTHKITGVVNTPGGSPRKPPSSSVPVVVSPV